MNQRIIFFIFLALTECGLSHSVLATSSKPFFSLSAECQEHCERQGERVDFVDSKMESRCDCYPA